MTVDPGEIEERMTELAEFAKLTRAWVALLEKRLADFDGWLRLLEFRLQEEEYENGIFTE